MNEIIENINLAKDIAKQNIEKQQEKSKERFDQKTKVQYFKLFDKVLIKSHKVPVGLSPKLVGKYHRPYYISEICPNFTYKIRDCKNRKEVKLFMNAVHLKHYNDPEVDRQHTNENTCTGNQNRNNHKMMYKMKTYNRFKMTKTKFNHHHQQMREQKMMLTISRLISKDL